MPKRLDITPKIKAALLKATDGAVDGTTVAVFETISLNTKPLSKKGLFDKGVVTETTLKQMVDAVNSGAAVPLHVMHDQAGNLPVGKTFLGEMFSDQNGLPELRSLFYVPLDKPSIVSDLENDVINEVSVGLGTKHINCSECGWDFLSEESTFYNLYNGMCKNEHEVGVDGVHVILNGLDRWYEQSLVSIGAANGAKIQSRTKALMGQDTYDKLAASGHPPELTTLFANSSLKKATTMDLEKLNASYIAASVELGSTKQVVTNLTAERDGLKTELTAATGKVTSLEAEVATLKTAAANFAATDAAKLKTEADAAKVTAEKARLTLHAEAKRMTVALGLEAPADDADIETLVASLATNRTKMAETFAPASVVVSATTAPKKSAFKGA